jgi:hypothetical protein
MEVFPMPRNLSRRRAAAGLSPVIESLEKRCLLSTDPLTVVTGAGAAKSILFTAGNGAQVQIVLAGSGTASIQLDGTNLTQSANARGLVINGSGISLTSISAQNTNGTSTLQIVTHGKHTFSAGSINVTGALNGLIAPGVMLTGDLTTTAGVSQLQLAGANEGSISIGAGKAASLVVKVGSVSDESLNSGTPIASITASQWINTVGLGKTITAPQISKLVITHDFSADITTASMASISIRGTLSNSMINLTTPLTRATNLNSLSVGGAIQNVTLNSGNSLGTITAAQLENSQIYAGLVASPSAPLPTVSEDFRNTSQIKAITLHHSASASFVNSDVASYFIGTVSLGGVNQSNGGTPFGLAAHQIKSVTIVDQASGKAVRVSNPATTTTFQNALTAKGVTPGDFQVRVV